MLKQPDYGVPFTEKRDTTELYKIPYYEDTAGVAPCGAIISNIQDMSHWLIALMNEREVRGQAGPSPERAQGHAGAGHRAPQHHGGDAGVLGTPESRPTGWAGGPLLTAGACSPSTAGTCGGFHSQVSFMPRERIGVIVFVIGDHCASLYNIVSYNVYERLLGLDQTPWSDRLLEIRMKGKKAGTEARAKAGAERVPDTKPSHALAGLRGRVRAPRLRRPEDRDEGRAAPVRLPQDSNSR